MYVHVLISEYENLKATDKDLMAFKDDGQLFKIKKSYRKWGALKFLLL